MNSHTDGPTFPERPNEIWRKPGNFALLVLAACVVTDILVARSTDEGDFLISMGVFGALLSRAFLDEPQSLIVALFGLALAVLASVGITM